MTAKQEGGTNRAKEEKGGKGQFRVKAKCLMQKGEEGKVRLKEYIEVKVI